MLNLNTKDDFELEVILHGLITGLKPVKPPSALQRVYISACESGDDQFDVVNVPRYCTDYNVTMPLFLEHKLSKSGIWAGGFPDLTLEVQSTSDSKSINQTPLRAIVIALIGRIGHA